MTPTNWFEDVCIMDKRTTPDGYGGVNVELIEGAHFKAGIVKKTSTQAMIAYQQGVKTMYVIAFEPKIALSPNDCIKRLSDGKVFCVTSDSKDMTTPKGAELKMSQVSAEVIDP